MPRVSMEGGDMHRTLAWAMRVAATALEMEGKKADERTQRGNPIIQVHDQPIA